MVIFPARNGGRRSMVDPQFVVLVVAGSSPVGHPIPPSLSFFCALEVLLNLWLDP